MKKITWAPVIPLVGGHPLGTEMAIGYPPEAIYSYDGFLANDRHYVNYQSSKNKNLQYNIIDDKPKWESVDFTVCTPPCAGLSNLNTGKSAAVKGVGCAKNEWMIRVIEDSIERLNAKVIIIENAPQLYTSKGEPFVERLLAIAKKYNRSLTLYKTNTQFHGIPQNRSRTFAFIWDTPNAPVLNYYDRERKNLTEYLREVSSDHAQYDIELSKTVHDEPIFKFIKSKFPETARDEIKSEGCSSLGYIVKKGLMEEFGQWSITTDNEKGIKFFNHYKNKAEKGMGVWDSSVRVYDEVSNAIISRNLDDTIHPEYDRSLNMREALHMMGHPHDFEMLDGRRSYQAITQNVPTCTARDMSLEVIEYLKGNRQSSNSFFVKQDNYKKKIDFSTNPVGPTLDI